MLRKTVFFWVGVLSCGLLLFVVVDHWQLTKVARRTSGKVTATSSTSTGCGSHRGVERLFTREQCKRYQADILYVVEGKTYHIEVSGGQDRHRDGPSAVRYLKGQQVRIAYDPRRPERAYVDSRAEHWTPPLFFLVLPIVCWMAARAEARLYANARQAQEQAAS